MSGRSIKNKRVRAVNTGSNADAGSVGWMIDRDPFLAYQLGRNLNFREFRSRDGVFEGFGAFDPFQAKGVAKLLGPMPDGSTKKITANNHTSCSGCHNLPQGNPGGGTNFHKDSGFGRQAPHYYGGGIMEMLAIQIRQDILNQVDTDGSGWISATEASSFSGNVLVSPTGGPANQVDFGSPALDGNGRPQLNNIFRSWYVDSNGVHLPSSSGVGDGGAVGYNFEMVVWGWGQGPGRSALNPTNRAFLWDPYLTHSGLDSFDPTTSNDPDGDGVSEPSLCGAIQFPATHQAPDKGVAMDPLGFSMDDPDGDGHLSEITEGDLDLAEFFMLNVPEPAFAGTNIQYNEGVQLLKEMDCTSCHVERWTIKREGAGFAGDRRTFELEVDWNAGEGRLEGSLNMLATQVDGVWERHFSGKRVSGIFTDFKHHEMGDGFAEVGLDGTVNTLWRTPPLWGVGSGFPWGHDGMSLTLEDAILRHGGDALASKAAYLSASPSDQAQLLDFLGRLRLYDLENLPTDLNGDGLISDNFVVAGKDTGYERFNAEWLFETPLEIQGDYVNVDGVTVTSFAGVNIDAAYGQLLEYRADDDDDGWPNVWDNAPATAGYKDGVNN